MNENTYHVYDGININYEIYGCIPHELYFFHNEGYTILCNFYTHDKFNADFMVGYVVQA